MNITELRYLVAIMKWGSVSAAAKQLYGCEELPVGPPVLCDVLLENAAGERRVLPYPDAELTALDINEGDTIALTDHKLSKVK